MAEIQNLKSRWIITGRWETEKRSQNECIESQVKYKQGNTLEKTPILKFRFEFELQWISVKIFF